jgi:hypothetical protein
VATGTGFLVSVTQCVFNESVWGSTTSVVLSSSTMKCTVPLQFRRHIPGRTSYTLPLSPFSVFLQ